MVGVLLLGRFRVRSAHALVQVAEQALAGVLQPLAKRMVEVLLTFLDIVPNNLVPSLAVDAVWRKVTGNIDGNGVFETHWTSGANVAVRNSIKVPRQSAPPARPKIGQVCTHPSARRHTRRHPARHLGMAHPFGEHVDHGAATVTNCSPQLPLSGALYRHTICRHRRWPLLCFSEPRPNDDGQSQRLALGPTQCLQNASPHPRTNRQRE